LGVDIIENCEVTGIKRDAAGAVDALETSRGLIRTRKVGVSAAGNTSVVLALAGVRFRWRAIRCKPSYPSRSNRFSPAW
jgi:sarcosine oxidase subunit beta